MITIFKPIITLLYVLSVSVFAQTLNSHESRGAGEQFVYDPAKWDGNEQIVTKLIKDTETILFVRTAKGEFEVRCELPKREVFFKFSSNAEAMSPGLRSAAMVDFERVGNLSAVLMLGERGYYYLCSSTTPIKLTPPFHFLPATILTTADNWMPVYAVGPCNFFPEAGGGVEDGIIKAGLKSTNEIEFERLPQNGQNEKIVFTVKEDHLLKNGLKIQDIDGLKVDLRGRVDERNFSKILEVGVKNSDIKESLIHHSKEDIFKFLSNFKDKDLGEKVKQRIITAWAE